MISEQLREVHAARPFEPFTMHLTDGRDFTVSHPEFLAVSPGGRTAYLAVGEHKLERIEGLMIVSISTDSSRRKRRKEG